MTDTHPDFLNKNNGPVLTLGITTDPIHHKIYGPLQSTRITTDSIRQKQSMDHSSPYGLPQIQFAINNLRTTPVYTD